LVTLDECVNFANGKKDNDPEMYKYKVQSQQREYRLRTRFNVLTKSEMEQKLETLIKTRQTNRERQRRYRFNQSIEKRTLRLQKDRNYQARKYKKQRQNSCTENNPIETNTATKATDEIKNYDTINNTRYIFFSS
jgi:hypothetical protein